MGVTNRKIRSKCEKNYFSVIAGLIASPVDAATFQC
jgi:hypothetical protein